MATRAGAARIAGGAVNEAAPKTLRVDGAEFWWLNLRCGPSKSPKEDALSG